MLCVHVYDLLDQPEQVVRIQEIKRVMKIGLHENRLKMWCMVNTDTQPIDYRLLCLETGAAVSNMGYHHPLKGFLDTVIMPDARVLHFWLAGPHGKVEF